RVLDARDERLVLGVALTQTGEAAQVRARGEDHVDVLERGDLLDDLDALRVFDHRDDHDVVVRPLPVFTSPDRAVLPGALAPFAERRIHRESDRVLDLLDGVDHRHDHAERPDIDGLLDVPLGRVGHPDERNRGPRARADHRRDFRVGQRAVLHLDPEEVEAGVRHRAIDVHARRLDRPTDDLTSGFELRLDRIDVLVGRYGGRESRRKYHRQRYEVSRSSGPFCFHCRRPSSCGRMDRHPTMRAKLQPGGDEMSLRCMSAAALLFVVGSAAAQSERVEAHVAAARAAAGEHAAMVDRLCTREPTAAAPGPRRPPPRGVPPREEWYREPVKVFDNLYFVGMTGFSTWAVTTGDGIIVIDPVFDYSVEASVVEGLQKLGFDPRDIRYVVVSHGHLDHAGGAKFLQETFGARVLMGAADWDLLDETNPPWKPGRDIEIVDGQKLTLGDTTLELHLTPGHTYGT